MEVKKEDDWFVGATSWDNNIKSNFNVWFYNYILIKYMTVIWIVDCVDSKI